MNTYVRKSNDPLRLQIISRRILLPNYDQRASAECPLVMEYLERMEAKPHDCSEPLDWAGPPPLATAATAAEC